MKSDDFISRPILLATLFLSICFFFSLQKGVNNYPVLSNKEELSEEFSNFDASSKYLYDLLKNPITGRIPAGIRAQELAQARTILNKQLLRNQPLTNNYSFQGPENIGGRTRAVVYDVRYNGTTNRTIMAGGVSGGIYKSVDDGATFIRKSPTDAIYSLTSIAQDPRPGFQDTWYYSTGEFYTGGVEVGAPEMGDGIFKSTDNGETWSKLPNSNTGYLEWLDRAEDCIWRVIVAPDGTLYMAAINQILRSNDGGENWYTTLNGFGGLGIFFSTDVVVTPSGRVYAAVSGYNNADADGIWTSPNGEYGTWTRIAGQGPGGIPAGWNAENFYGRLVLAVSPSDESMVYAYMQVFNASCYGLTAGLFKWNMATSSWTDLSNNLPGCGGYPLPLNTLGGYAMTIAIKPDDPNTVIIGGSNLYRSTDGFATPYNTTEIAGYIDPFASHPDMHSLAFEPGHPNTLLVGDDGGLHGTVNIMTSPHVNWFSVNRGFRTVQFYHVVLAPMTGSNYVLGGTQDNGTMRNIGGNGTNFQLVLGGDGGPVGISDSSTGAIYEYCSYQFGEIHRRSQTSTPFSASPIKPPTPAGDRLFISPFHLDPDNTELLYYVYGDNLYRTSSASTVTGYEWTAMWAVAQTLDEYALITALATTRGNYNSITSSLFFGTRSGRIYRIDDPVNADPFTPPVDITNNIGLGYVSSISVNPRDDDTILVTMSSYGGINIWLTGNAKDANPDWVNVERNLTLPAVRSSAIAVTPTGLEYFVGTTVGLFKSTDPFTNDWTQEGPTEIGNAVVTSLYLRPSDNRLLVGTYGYGMWVTNLPPICNPNIWTGAVNSSWENPGNWSCGFLPNSNSHVMINAGTPNNPVINSDVTIKQLTVNSTGVLTVNFGYKLNITNPP